MTSLRLPVLTACLALTPLVAQTSPEDLTKRVETLEPLRWGPLC
jgi:hypothetical protein